MNRPPTQRCGRCEERKPEAEFSPARWGRSGAYCRPCCAAYQASLYGGPRPKALSCACCGASFKRSQKQNASNAFCSRKCKSDFGNEQKRQKRLADSAIKCGWCGVSTNSLNGRKYCSIECNQNRKNAIARGRTLAAQYANFDRHCASCGDRIPITRQAKAKYCSEKCNVREHRPRIGGVSRMYFFERDGGECHLCSKPVGRFEFELDHVVPRALGGGDDAANLRISHPRCNRSKGIRPIGEQLMLVG